MHVGLIGLQSDLSGLYGHAFIDLADFERDVLAADRVHRDVIRARDGRNPLAPNISS